VRTFCLGAYQFVGEGIDGGVWLVPTASIGPVGMIHVPCGDPLLQVEDLPPLPPKAMRSSLRLVPKPV
jgi:hypothetical protein